MRSLLECDVSHSTEGGCSKQNDSGPLPKGRPKAPSDLRVGTSRYLVLSVFGLALGSLGCTADESETEEPTIADATKLSERPCPEDSILSYENFGEPFLLSWCNGCHSSVLPEGERQGAPLGSDFDDLAMVREAGARIWARSADHNRQMPPLAGPEDEERTRLGEWLACGAPSEAE